MIRWEMREGDCLRLMEAMPAASAHSIITDPPYGLGFMGAAWDHDVPGVDFWRAALRVAKPGAPLVAFGGSRTFHRLACAIEDAGWELRDTLCWLYGSGFPKGPNVGKLLDRRRNDRDATARARIAHAVEGVGLFAAASDG